MKEVYAAAGVPCKCICDFDVLNNHNLFKGLLKSFGVSQEKRQDYLSRRTSLEDCYRQLEGKRGNPSDKMPDEVKDHYKHDVFRDVGGNLQENILAMLNDLSSYGLFILSSGEMESLFVSDGIEHAHDSNDWLGKAMNFIASQSEQELWSNVVVKAYFDFVA